MIYPSSANFRDIAIAWDPTEPVATRPLVMQRNGGWNFFYTHDGNKNVSDVVSFQQARGVPAHYEYAPFGEVTVSATNTAFTAFNVAATNPFRFSSEYADDALGLVYYNYRHYQAAFGRFLSADPLGIIGGGNHYNLASGVLSLYIDYLGLSSPEKGVPGFFGSFLTEEHWQDSLEIYKGYGDAVLDTCNGIVNTVSHLIETAENLCNGICDIAHKICCDPSGVWNTVPDDFQNTFNDPRSTGGFVGEALITVGVLGSSAASKGAMLKKLGRQIDSLDCSPSTPVGRIGTPYFCYSRK